MKGRLPLVRVFTPVVAWASSLRRRLLPPPLALLEISTAIWPALALRAAVLVGLMDRLAKGAASSQTLASELQLHAPSVHRVLRLLCAYDVVRFRADERFALTAIGRYAVRNVPDSVAAFVEYAGEPWHLTPWARLDETLRSGEPAFDRVFDCGFFEYAQAHPDVGRGFERAMAAASSLHADAVAAAYDFSNASLLVDVGGGSGTLLRAILAKFSGLRATLYALPVAANDIGPDLGPRATVEAGDFFERVPGPAKTYLLSHILHDWDDGHSLQILRNIRAQVEPGGRVLIIEALLDGNENRWSAAVLTDVQMLTMLHGRERTLEEYTDLLRRAGFRVRRVIPTAAAESILECVPV